MTAFQGTSICRKRDRTNAQIDVPQDCSSHEVAEAKVKENIAEMALHGIRKVDSLENLPQEFQNNMIFDRVHVDKLLTATQFAARTIVGASDQRLKNCKVGVYRSTLLLFTLSFCSSLYPNRAHLATAISVN